MSEVWIVYRFQNSYDGWDTPKEIIVGEHNSEYSARQHAQSLDWGKDLSSPTWHSVKKVTKHTYYS